MAAEEDGNRTATVTAVLFEAADRDAVGAAAVVSGSGTPAMARRGACTEGSLVVAHRRAGQNTNSSSGWPKVLSASFLPVALEASFPDETIPIPRTGMYNLRFVHCHASLGVISSVSASGKMIWRNGLGGYLPGRMAPLESFYGAMSLAFAALAAFWFTRSRTINKLKARRMAAKLDAYRRLGNAATIAAAVSLGWAAFEAHFRWTEGGENNDDNERWRVAWVIPAVWQLISFALLCAVCLAWAPSHDSASRLACCCADDAGVHGDGHDDDGVEEELPLVRVPGPLSYVGSWACYVTQDDAKIILRTDSGGVYAKAGQEDKRV